MRKVYLVFFIWILVDVWLMAVAYRPDSPGFYFLDVGQGDAELLVLAGSRPLYILIDGGPDGEVVSRLAGLLPWPTGRLDMVISTHADKDHSGGLDDVLRQKAVGLFVYNGASVATQAWQEVVRAKSDIREVVVREGDVIKYGDNILRVLHPRSVYGQEQNLNSVIVEIKTPEMSGLFTGDIDASVERVLFDRGLLEPVDVLKVAHHGSKYASSEVFLEAVKPKISVIEVGKNNYGHPTEEALNRLANVGSFMLKTIEEGTIKVESVGGELIVSRIAN